MVRYYNPVDIQERRPTHCSDPSEHCSSKSVNSVYLPKIHQCKSGFKVEQKCFCHLSSKIPGHFSTPTDRAFVDLFTHSIKLQRHCDREPIYKLLAQQVNERLQAFMEQNQILPDTQNGFRKENQRWTTSISRPNAPRKP